MPFMGGSWARREWRALQQKSSFAARQRGVFYDKEKSMTESARLVITVDSSQALAAGRDLQWLSDRFPPKCRLCCPLWGARPRMLLPLLLVEVVSLGSRLW